MKRKALTITLAAVNGMGTCAVTASAVTEIHIISVYASLVQHDALDAATQGSKMKLSKNSVKRQLHLMSRTHRVIPIPVQQSLTALFPTTLT